MSRFPVDLLRATVSTSTSGAANTTVATTVLGVPNAGTRYRIWRIGFFCFPANTGGLYTEWQTSGTTQTFAGISAPAKASQSIDLPGGFALPAGQGVRVLQRSDIATQDLRLFVHYTVEPI